MEQLRIDKPCNENWNEFTPKPEGGFCASCQKIVIDFTNKSNSEISEILSTRNGENLCGKIGTSQLNNFNKSFTSWQNNFTNQGFQSRFLWALVIAFGFSLFSSQNIIAQEVMGKIAFTEQAADTIVTGDSVKTNDSTDKTIDVHEVIMGDMILEPSKKDTALIVDSVSTEISLCKKPKLDSVHTHFPIKVEQTFIMGSISYQPEVVEVEKSELKPTKLSVPQTPIGQLFPNPAEKLTTLKLAVKIAETYEVKIFNQEGKVCQIVLVDFLAKGDHEMTIDLHEYESGLYHIAISSNSHQSTIQLIKK